jgi:hypothetical protein
VLIAHELFFWQLFQTVAAAEKDQVRLGDHQAMLPTDHPRKLLRVQLDGCESEGEEEASPPNQQSKQVRFVC